MDPTVSTQLEKVLALADSTHEGEAVLAVRKARQMLSRDGLSFADLARAASRKPALSRAFSLFSSSPQVLQAEAQLAQLRQKLDDVQVELQAQQVQIEFWRRRAAELEQNFHGARSDAERWRQMARETVAKLWDLGQEIHTEEFASDGPAGEASKQKTA